MAKHRAAWWWVDRWRKSTAYTDMSLAEQGAYRNLLDELWLRGGVLPDDDRVLAKVSGDAMAWPSIRPSVMARFYKTREGWRHETHDEVSRSSPNFHKSQSEKGKKGAAAKWRNHRKDGPANSPASSPAIKEDSPANSPANGQIDGLRTPSPYSVSGSVHRTPERAASGVDGSTSAPPPPAASVSGIPHDPTDPLQVRIVERVLNLARRDAAGEGREPTQADVLGILRDVSTTPKTGAYLTDLRGANAAWLTETLRTCDRFEEDHEDLPDLEWPDP
jgi:uncharacterized protein YdaU (DUF1376 family)